MFYKFVSYLLKNQVIFALFLIVAGWFVFQIREIIVSIFIAYIIMAALLPLVEFLRKKGMPKMPAVLLTYFSVLIAVFLLILPLVPFVAAQVQALAKNLPDFIDRSAGTLGFSVDQKEVESYITSELQNLGKGAVNITTKVFGGLFSTITIFVVSLYLLLYEDNFKKFLASLFHRDSREKALKTLDQINFKLGAWLRGQLQLSVFIGFFSWIGLSILGIPYALPLALIAGILEVIPTIGPILSAIPAVIVALTISPTLALMVIGLYVIIQAVENQFLVPKVMQIAVGLNPVVVILAIMIGANLMGVAGALLAIPFVSFLVVLFKSLE